MVRRPAPRQPGEKPDTESDADKAILAGKQGKTHRVAKHPDLATLPKSKVQGDPERPADAAVNAKKEMSYEKAMAALRDRNELDRLLKVAEPNATQAERIEALRTTALMRNVLTEQGWVCVNREPPARV